MDNIRAGLLFFDKVSVFAYGRFWLECFSSDGGIIKKGTISSFQTYDTNHEQIMTDLNLCIRTGNKLDTKHIGLFIPENYVF